MKKTPWFPGNTFPIRDGWYERDHRGCYEYSDPADRRICLDMFYAVRDKRDPLYPGIWYVQSDPYWFYNPFTGQRSYVAEPMDDASRQDLPWRGLTERAE